MSSRWVLQMRTPLLVQCTTHTISSAPQVVPAAVPPQHWHLARLHWVSAPIPAVPSPIFRGVPHRPCKGHQMHGGDLTPLPLRHGLWTSQVHPPFPSWCSLFATRSSHPLTIRIPPS